jgi:hypothetical protein
VDRATRYARYRAQGELEQAALGMHGYNVRVKAHQLSYWKRFDPALVIIIAVFVAFEVVAHYHFHNANGWWTLSNRIVTFEHKYGWPARAVVYGGIAILAVHLWGGVF